MKVFVSGASGFQGGNIAHQLIRNQHEVVTLKNVTKEGPQPAEKVEIVAGGFQDKTALTQALKGTKAAVYTFPLIFDLDTAKEYTRNFIQAAEENNVELVVFNATFDLPKDTTGYLGVDMKVAMKALFDESNLNVITLVPDIYIDNISAPWSIPVIMNNGILPYPIQVETKIPFISHVDLGKFVSSAITKPELAGQTLPIATGLLTGEEIASAISSKINKPVNFVSVLPNEFEQQLVTGFGELAAKEISNLYRYVADQQSNLVSKDFVKSQKLLGVIPQSLNDWVDSVQWG